MNLRIGLLTALAVVAPWAAAAATLEWTTGEVASWAELPIASEGRTGFALVPQESSGILFTNALAELSGAANRVLYNGAGLAAGDIDGDGWPDLFFCDLSGNNRLYRNLGGWRFEDVTQSAGLGTPVPWSRGAVLADLNGDGSADLLLSVNGRGVLCFLNDGKGKFRDATESAGTGGREGSTTMALADVNGDGSLDLYIANYRTEDIRDRGQVRIRMVGGRPVMAGGETNRFAMVNGRLEETGQPDRLLLNDGAGKFRPVSWTDGAFLDEAGRPLAEPPGDWGLAAMFRDVNGDGAPDLYVCNDYWTPDRMWINDGRGRFRAIERKALRHLSASSMGVDFADVDRDGYLDFFVVDMLSRYPALRKRQKFAQEAAAAAIGATDERPQLVHNTLFLNRGDGTYAEVSHWAGVQATDWSWAPLFLDVDLDGYEDLLVGAGHFRDVQDYDAEAVIQSRQHSWEGIRNDGERQRAFTQELMEHYRLYPLLQMPIGGFRNRGDGTFEEVTGPWGLDHRGVHQGLVYADFDLDGDLDLAVNSLNGPALLLRNDSVAPRVAVRVKGDGPNQPAVGAKVTLRGGAVPAQSTELVAGGRYLSGCDLQAVFACGNARSNLTLEVVWRNGARAVVSNVVANRRYEIRPAKTRLAAGSGAPKRPAVWFKEVALPPPGTHPETPFEDFERQPLAPYRQSQLGPGLAWTDLNGDGRLDLAVGAGKFGAPSVYLGDGRGGMTAVASDQGLALPDDAAGLLGWRVNTNRSLLVSLTGYETDKVPAVLGFHLAGEKLLMGLPVIPQVGPAGALALGDPQGTGRMALFVAGGAAPGRYPVGAPSRLYWFDGSRWIPDAANQALFEKAGLVNAALWSDLDGDGFSELVLACEWGPLRVFRWRGTGFVEATEEWGLAQLTGLWRGVTAGDFNQDGRLDLIAANWGLNSPYQASATRPLVLAFGPLNGADSFEVIETEWAADRVSPRRQSLTLRRSLPFLGDRLPSYRALSEASLDEVLGEQKSLSQQVQAATLASTLLLNTGGKFQAAALPREAQFAPAFGVTVADFNGDGFEDAFLAQNLTATSAELPRMDAGVGLLLRGDGEGRLTTVPPAESGIQLWGDQRGVAAADFDEDGRTDLAVGQNGDATRLFRNARGTPGLRVRLQGRGGNPDAVGAVIRLQYDGRMGAAREIHAGAGYWSQDSAIVAMGPSDRATGVWIRWPGGKTTTTPMPAGAVELVIQDDGAIVSRR